MTDQEELTELRQYRKLVETSFWLALNMNDVFGFGCADAENMPVEDIKHVLPLFNQYGYDALLAYAAVKRGGDPLKQLRTIGYWDAKEKLNMLRDNIPGFMCG